MKRPVSERLWSRVDTSGGPDACWEWLGQKSKSGYGRIGTAMRKSEQTHRVAYALTYGPIPAGDGPHGTCVCHHCDNRACCNPSHLFLGTVADNNADKRNKGRQPPVHGSNNPNCKLTEQQVLEIRAARGTHRSIGEAFGIRPNHVYYIKTRKLWRSLPDGRAE